MASKKQIILIMGISIALVVLIGWWVDQNNKAPELLLDVDEALEGPLSPEELKIDNQPITNNMNRVAVLNTNKGAIEIELFEDVMPITTENFITLAEDKYYDGIKFHRIISGFMVQAGDPNTKGDDVSIYGQGGPGFTIQDEFVEGELLTNTRGTISMANTGQPNSGGSQFFINTVDNTNLDFNKEPLESKHPVFGRIVNGMDVVDSISQAEVGQSGLPLEPIVIESVEVKIPEPAIE